MKRWCASILLLGFCVTLSRSADLSEADHFDRFLDGLPVVAEIEAGTQAPDYEVPGRASESTRFLGRTARWLSPADQPKAMGWVIGQKAGLKPGHAYVLSIEYPDDVPRSVFVANRGADQVRGFATGKATGDVRRQYTQPSLESLDYPQTGQWQRFRSLFVLHHRFQGEKAQRDPKPGGRPRIPSDGFHVIIFQSNQINDPRSAGAAIGRIRLHAVPDLKQLYPAFEKAPGSLPQRQVFFREEMGDEPISGKAPEDRACPDPIEWFVWKAQVTKALGFNTFAKDLLEFGHNQGWDSGDQKWLINAQPPLTDAWERMAPRVAALGLKMLPYYEYKGALGWNSPSLGWQRRAEKLYHGQPNTNYTGTWWVENHNADLTDPDTLADLKRVLEKTILKHRDQAEFAGAWLRTRGNHLPIGFGKATLERYARARRKGLVEVTRQHLIQSYETDRKLYNDYIDWWLEERSKFLSNVQQSLAEGLGRTNVQLLFTPWPSEPLPLLRDPGSGPAGHPVQITTDDPAWWEAFAKGQGNSSWFRWAYSPKDFSWVIAENVYGRSLDFREPISTLPWRTEAYHAAPNGDPERYRNGSGVMLTYPIGRLFTVARKDLLESYRTPQGLTVIQHFPLNEDNPTDKGFAGPFGGLAGYTCVDVDRAGPHVRLMEARAIANGDPVNIGYLMGSAFSSGFPGYVRQFNQAFLAVPALPSRLVQAASVDSEVVVREVQTPHEGTYYYIVNTSMRSKENAEIRFPNKPVQDLLTKRTITEDLLRVKLYPGELRSYVSRGN